MWEFEHTIEVAEVTPVQVWARYTDTATWHEWNPGILHVALDGPFAAGTIRTTTFLDQAPLHSTITEATENTGFTEETTLPGVATVRSIHRLSPRPGGGTLITHRMEMDGPTVSQPAEATEDLTESLREELKCLAKALQQTG